MLFEIPFFLPPTTVSLVSPMSEAGACHPPGSRGRGMLVDLALGSPAAGISSVFAKGMSVCPSKTGTGAVTAAEEVLQFIDKN